EGFDYDKCLKAYPIIVATVITVLWLGIFVRLHFTLAVHSLYNRMAREESSTSGVMYLAVPFDYDRTESGDVQEETLPSYPGNVEREKQPLLRSG
ncbi:hypothetical protein HDU93_001125, partial [Gonapodya sp. JEL0774]